MNITITKKDAKLLLVLLGILILLVGYLAVYTKYSNLTDDMNGEIKDLKVTADELQGYYDKLDTYRAGIDAADAVVTAELAKYPSAVRYEDQVMYAIGLQEDTGLEVTGIAYANPVQVSAFQRLTRDGNTVTASNVTAMEYPVTLTMNLTYAQLKGLISYVDATELRTALDIVSVSFDAEIGNLTGSVVINQYSVSDGTEPYAATEVPDVPLGVSDLFGTYEAQATETDAVTTPAN
ncbi:MAG: hypothetical protein VB055_09870 [Oscillospiraceae bacterium]|nr:hypothetical protein [Oscillospiraceae bacterium]